MLVFLSMVVLWLRPHLMDMGIKRADMGRQWAEEGRGCRYKKYTHYEQTDAPKYRALFITHHY